MKKIFVIIVTYNGKCWYDRCFQSLRKSLLPLNIIVIDNSSSDNSVEYIRTNYPEVKVIESANNLGFGKANNIGIRYALERKCDYVFLLNQDAWIKPDTIVNLLTVSEKNPDYGIISPIHLRADEQKIEDGLLHYIVNWKLTDRNFISDMYLNKLLDLYDTSYVNAAAWFLPVKTLNMVGGFDPIFVHYDEDSNYLQRVLYHGLKVGLCPNSKIIHDTERRLTSMGVKGKRTNNGEQLAEYTDINISFHYYKMVIFHFRKAIIKLLKLKFNSYQYYKKQFCFLLKNKNRIKVSREQNLKIGKNWL